MTGAINVKLSSQSSDGRSQVTKILNPNIHRGCNNGETEIG